MVVNFSVTKKRLTLKHCFGALVNSILSEFTFIIQNIRIFVISLNSLILNLKTTNVQDVDSGRKTEKMTLIVIKELENNSNKKQVSKTYVRHSVKWNTLPAPAFAKWFNIEMWSLSAISYKRKKITEKAPNVLGFY